MLFRSVYVSCSAETEGPFLRIENMTDQALMIFQERGGRMFEVLEVSANSSAYLPDNCAAAEYVALTRGGQEIARRPRSSDCNLEDWIIERRTESMASG